MKIIFVINGLDTLNSEKDIYEILILLLNLKNCLFSLMSAKLKNSVYKSVSMQYEAYW